MKHLTGKIDYKSLLFVSWLFIFLPCIRLESTLDPVLAPRFFICSLSLMILFIYWIIRPPEPISFSVLFLICAGIFLSGLVWMFVSTFTSINAGDAQMEFLRIIVIYLFFLAAYLFLKKENHLVFLLGIFSFISLLIFSAFGAVQIYKAWNTSMTGGTPFHIDLSIGSSLANKNFFSEVLIMLLPLQLLNYLTQKGKIKFIFLAGILIALFWILLLQYIASWLAIIATIIVALVFSGRKLITAIKLNSLIIIFATLITSAILLFAMGDKAVKPLSQKINVAMQYIKEPALLDSTSDLNNNSVFERIILWRNSLKLIEEHPVTGAGLNNWKIFQTKFGCGGTAFLNSGLVQFEHPHNDYLMLWAEQGPIGLILFLSIFVFLFLHIRKSLKTALPFQDKHVLRIAGYALLSFGIISFFGYPRYRIYVMMLFILNSVLIVLFSEGPGKYSLNNSRARILFLLLATLSALGVYAAGRRIQGEQHTKLMLKAQFEKNYARMVREADRAESWFYTMDLTGTPLSWYRGMAFFYSGLISRAIPEYEEALKINPWHVKVLNDLATAYEQSGKRDSAIMLYRRGLQVLPLFTEGLLNLSAAYYNNGQSDSAFSVISRIQKMKIAYREQQNYKLFLDAILKSRVRNIVEKNFPKESAVKLYGYVTENMNLEELFVRSGKSEIKFEEALLDSLKLISVPDQIVGRH